MGFHRTVSLDSELFFHFQALSVGKPLSLQFVYLLFQLSLYPFRPLHLPTLETRRFHLPTVPSSQNLLFLSYFLCLVVGVVNCDLIGLENV